jgi:hypothetical protein
MKTESSKILWATEIKAKSPIDAAMKTYCGPNVPGETQEEAQEYCEANGLGYCWVIGQLIAEIPCIEGTFEPDWNNQINYKEIDKKGENH